MGGNDPGSSAQLRALQADPMARYVPESSRLTRAHSSPEGVSLGKPHQAKLTRLFTLSGAPRTRLEAAVRHARASGWRLERTLHGAVGEKRLARGRAVLTISLLLEEGLLPSELQPPVLTLGLTHLGE